MNLSMMRIRLPLLLLTGLLSPMLVVAAPQTDPVAARYHFVGATRLAATPGATTINRIASLPSTADFRRHVARKTALELAESLGRQLNPASTNAAALMVPLLDDLIGCESAGVFGGRANEPMSFVLAVQLSPAQATLWQENLGKLLGAAPETCSAEGLQGRLWKKAAFRIFPAKDWLVISRGDALAAQQAEMLASLGKTGRPAAALSTNWFEADADWTRLAVWLPLESSPFKLARTQISLAFKDDNIVTKMRIRYPEAIVWKAQPWNVPTNLVRDPLISFTAARDVAPFLAPSPLFSQLKANPWNEQFFVWAMWMGGMPFQTFGAMPVQDPTNTYRALALQLPALFNAPLEKINAGAFVELTNHQAVVLTGLPQLAPRIRPYTEASGGFLAMDFFGGVSPRTTKPAPPELLAQLDSQKNIIYYDWEYTEKRLECWKTMSVFLPVLRTIPTPIPGIETLPPFDVSATNRSPALPHVATSTWITAIAPLLGNTITVATLENPNEVAFTRNSKLGFTGFELMVLADRLTGASYTPFRARGRRIALPMAPSAGPVAAPTVPNTVPKPKAPAAAPVIPAAPVQVPKQ